MHPTHDKDNLTYKKAINFSQSTRGRRNLRDIICMLSIRSDRMKSVYCVNLWSKVGGSNDVY